MFSLKVTFTNQHDNIIGQFYILGKKTKNVQLNIQLRKFRSEIFLLK